jgi:CheY-like chemotaxis protein
MGFLTYSLSAGFWIAPMAALTLVSLAAAVILVRDHVQLERDAAALAAELVELKEEHRRTAERGERERMALSAQHDAVVLTDEHGAAVFVNDAFARLVRHPADTLVGKAIRPIPAATRAARDLGEGRRLIEEAYRFKEGDRWVAWIETPVKLPGFSGTLRVGREVTEYFRQQRRIGADAFNAGLIADLRPATLRSDEDAAGAPLIGLVGLVDLLLKTRLTQEQDDYLNAIRRLAEALIAAKDTPPATAVERDAPGRSDPLVPFEGPFAGRRVLLAEDNETNAQLVLNSLENTGAMIDWARDGEEAVALVEQSFADVRPAYDLVLMDMRMPKLDGLAATRGIRALEERFRRPVPIRIVALTATAMKRDRKAAHEAGVDGFLPKPYQAQALLQLLASPGSGAGVGLARAS